MKLKTSNWMMLLAVGAVFASCGSKQEEQKETALRVKTETAKENTIADSRTYVGQVEEKQSTVLSFTGTGTVLQMLVDEGQRVSKGQLVAVLDETQMRNALAASEAILAQAKDGYERLKQVHEAGSLPEQQWVEIQSRLRQAQASRDMAQKALKECRLVSPVSGIVGRVSLRAGETALPAQPVCTVLDISSVKISASIPEGEIGLITEHTPSTIQVEAAGVNGLRGGRIERGVQADAITRTYNIKINLPNADGRLLPGMVAQASIRQEGNGKAITLPITSVQQATDGSHFVWIARDGKAHRQGVEPGALTGNRVEILSGLKAGDQVIVEGYQKVSENCAVSY